jgi:hypothetical protein
MGILPVGIQDNSKRIHDGGALGFSNGPDAIQSLWTATLRTDTFKTSTSWSAKLAKLPWNELHVSGVRWQPARQRVLERLWDKFAQCRMW